MKSLSAKCFAKLNLTLRILGREKSGFHKLCSIFYKIGPVDYLTITTGVVDNVKVKFERKKSVIEGRNILLKTLDKVRDRGAVFPFLNMELSKSVPPGTGVGAGSGDAGALIELLESKGVYARQIAAEVGSDVPFFCSPSKIALVRGRGEILKQIDGSLPLRSVVAIPEWRCITADMFRLVDKFFASRWPMDEAEAEKESKYVLDVLRSGKTFGLLPNDFCSVLLNMHAEYEELFECFRRQGAIAWGISGSGSAAFALWPKDCFRGFSHNFEWIDDIFIF